MYLTNARVLRFVFEFVKTKIDFENAAVSSFKISHLEKIRLQNRFIELKIGHFSERRHISNPNGVTIQKFPLIQDDHNYSMRVNKRSST